MRPFKTPKLEHVHAVDGRSIPYIFSPSFRRRVNGVFVLIHGLGVDKSEYCGFYTQLADALTAAGYAVLQFDLPAHGDSNADPSAFTLMNCIADSMVVASVAMRRAATRKLHVFGTSFGAGPAVVVSACFRRMLETTTLLAPALDYKKLYICPTATARARYRGFLAHSVLAGKKIRINSRVAFNWRNAVEFASVDLDGLLKDIAARTAIIHGTADSMVPVALSRGLAKRIPDLDLTIIPRMEHGFMDRDDESGVGRRSRVNFDQILRKALR